MKWLQELEVLYQDRLTAFFNEKEYLAKKYNWFAHIRLILFLVFIFLIYKGITGLDSPHIAYLIGGCVIFIIFIGSIIYHHRIQHALKKAETLHLINDEALRRIHRQWEHLPIEQVPDEWSQNPLSIDLDLFGGASLYQLLGPINTPSGRNTMGNWLLNPADKEEIELRQEAVAELADDIENRQKFTMYGYYLRENSSEIEPFLKWAEESSWLLPQKKLVYFSRLMTLLTLLSIIGHVTGFIPVPLWLICITINLILTALYARKIHKVYARVSLDSLSFFHYGELFLFLNTINVSKSKLINLKKTLSVEEQTSYTLIQELAKKIQLSELRLSGMLYFPVQLITLWDFHVLYEIEKWQTKVGTCLREWFDVLGEFESLFALSDLKFNNPLWSFPHIETEGPPQLIAKQIGHPLLHPESCVRNNVSILPDKPLLLVTGSNMSGKSTLLRTLGVNIVLAQIGGPVCADELSIPQLVLGTSFRIHDSLASGISYFMAELNRIKSIVERAKTTSKENRSFMYLLDEILLGTNIHERQIAVIKIILMLLQTKSLGAMATHDLTIAEAPEIKDFLQPVHFREEFDEIESGPTMRFDYLLQQGVSQTTNALKLLKIIGLK